MHRVFCDPAAAAWVSTAGLGLDIVGVILLFFHGLPHDAAYGTTLEWGDRRERDDWKRALAWSRLGLVLLVAGFFLQAVSNHLCCLGHLVLRTSG